MEKKSNLSAHDAQSVPSARGLKVAICYAEWNPEITLALKDAAVDTLSSYGCLEQDISLYAVPGSFELVYAASELQRSGVNAVIAIGCVIKGETPHFDFISEAVANGLALLNTKGSCPVIFGVLTTLNMDQARDRSGGIHGNKGVEAAVTAIKMARLFQPHE